MAVTGKVDESEIGVAPRQIGQRAEWNEGIPVLVFGALEKPGCGSLQRNQVELSVAGQIEELLPARTQLGQRRPARHGLHGTAAAVAETGLVLPGIALFGEDARDAFPVQIDPLILRPIEPIRTDLHTVTTEDPAS